MPSKFQVVSIRPRAGIAAKSQKPYNMVVVKGVFTDPDGVVDTGELVFMEGPGRPLPSLTVGSFYEPIAKMYVNYENKLVSLISELRLVGKSA